MKKSAIVIAIVLPLAVAGVVIGLLFFTDHTKTVAESAELTPVTFMLDWTPNVNHVGIFVAAAEGYFAAQGLAVEIVQPGEVYPAAAVLSNRAQFGVDYQEYLTLFSNDQQGLVSIAAMLQSNTSGFAVRAGVGASSIADLASLTYGTFNAPFEKPTLDALLACAGGSADGIEYVPVGSDLLTLMNQQLIDVAWIFYGTQGFQAQQIGVDIDYFPMSDYTDCIPDYYTPIIIAAEEYIQQKPEVVRALLAALDQAYQFIIDNPQQAADLLAAAVPELNRDELRQSVPWLSAYMQDSNGKWGTQQASVWQEYATWMYERGLLTNSPTVANMQRLFTNVYLP